VQPDSLPEIESELKRLSGRVTVHLQALPETHLKARQILTNSLQILTVGEEKFRELIQRTHDQRKGGHDILTILVPTDLLFQSWQSLFPAERMIVVAGRTRENKIVLGAGFDVTGSSSAGHVQADPQQLGQALIAMSASDTHLAAWFHSHPGSGGSCTLPSTTDLRQQSDWLQDYSAKLLSGIFVQDGYFHLWGSALENGQIEIELIGSGVKLEGKEHVYRINPS
jgi:hypothetical protein